MAITERERAAAVLRELSPRFGVQPQRGDVPRFLADYRACATRLGLRDFALAWLALAAEIELLGKGA